MDPVTTIQQLDVLKQSTIVMSAIICLAAIAVSFVVATLVPYKGGRDTSHVTRRVWYAIIGILAASGYLIYNYLVVLPAIKNPGFQSQFSQSAIISVIVMVVGYIILSIVLALLFRKSKFATIYFKPKK